MGRGSGQYPNPAADTDVGYSVLKEDAAINPASRQARTRFFVFFIVSLSFLNNKLTLPLQMGNHSKCKEHTH